MPERLKVALDANRTYATAVAEAIFRVGYEYKARCKREAGKYPKPPRPQA